MSRFKIAWLMLTLVVAGAPATQAWALPIVRSERGFTTGTNEQLTRFQHAGPITIVDATYVDQLTGFLTGPAPGSFEQIANSTTGTAVFYGTEVCTCTTAGRSGTITVFFEGTTASNGISVGKIVFYGGTGGLAGLTGTATFKGDINKRDLPYTGEFVFSS